MTNDDDSYDLARFVQAQDAGGTYAAALDQLRRGRKTGHWMWFVFPQINGLGLSDMSRRYAITSLNEARAYLDHPTLGQRLRASAQALLDCGNDDVVAVMGGIDAQKLRSSMTLFHLADPDDATFAAVIERFFNGQLDPETEARV